LSSVAIHPKAGSQQPEAGQSKHRINLPADLPEKSGMILPR
jgi:hypothetical protein